MSTLCDPVTIKTSYMKKTEMNKIKIQLAAKL